jgi:hypothetical protein
MTTTAEQDVTVEEVLAGAILDGDRSELVARLEQFRADIIATTIARMEDHPTRLGLT